MDKLNENEKKLLSVLFALGNISKSQIKRIGVDILSVNIELLNEKLAKSNLPFVIVNSEENIEFALDEQMSDFIRQILNKEKNEDLTESSAQVLSLILYCAPISKAEIDYIRGVNSGATIRKLIMRGLITKKKEGATVTYHPSAELLANLGLKTQDELEGKEEFCEKIRNMLNLK